MKTTLRKLFLLTLVTLASSWASAATLNLQPGTQTVATGTTFYVDLVISGLGDTTAPALGDFEVNIGFDAARLSFSDYVLGPLLGDTSAFGAFDASFGELAPGVVNIAEVSFLSVAELEVLQPAEFVLATLEFTASGLAPGDSTAIDIASVLALGDAFGNPLIVDGAGGTTISAVPLPAAAWLFGAALFSLALGWRRTSTL